MENTKSFPEVPILEERILCIKHAIVVAYTEALETVNNQAYFVVHALYFRLIVLVD